jgi:aminoglycoside 3-N-acetyltransferase I
MAAPYTIRRLTRDDVSLMRALNVVFGGAFSDPDRYGANPPSDAYLEQLLARDHTVVLVALADDGVVGGLVAYVLDKFEQPRRELYIYDLAVAEPHRRRGLATSLISRLREMAAPLDASAIYVQADYGDEGAIALYERLGFRHEVLHFDIPVST